MTTSSRRTLLGYVSVSTGFKGGGVNPRPFVADQRLPFNPETLTTYEAGLKSEFFDRKMRLNGAVFLNKYEDIILGKTVCPESSLPTPCLRPANIGTADVKGAELELLGVPAAWALVRRKLQLPRLRIHVGHERRTACCWRVPAFRRTASRRTRLRPSGRWARSTITTPRWERSASGSMASYQGKLFTNAENTSWATSRRALPRQRTPELVRSDGEVARVVRSAKPVRQVLLHVGQRCDHFARPRHGRTRSAAHVHGVDRTQVLIAEMATMLFVLRRARSSFIGHCRDHDVRELRKRSVAALLETAPADGRTNVRLTLRIYPGRSWLPAP